MRINSQRSESTGYQGATRLESWKQIAAYLKRHVTTVRRWEREEGLPVHRHLHNTLSSIYAYSTELDRWLQTRPGSFDHSSRPAMSREVSNGWFEPAFAPRSAVPGSPVELFGRDVERQIVCAAWDLTGK